MAPMTVEHDHTDQEQQIWDHLEAGDHDAIDALEQAAYRDQPAELPVGALSPAEQFDVDYRNAYAHYQDAHEAPEPERIENTAEIVEAQNERAPDA
jgi:hypothetical protein